MSQRNSVYNESYTRLSQLDFLNNRHDFTSASPTSLSLLAQTTTIQAPLSSTYQTSSQTPEIKPSTETTDQTLKDKFDFKPNDVTKSLQVIQTSQIKLRLNQKAGDFLNHHRELIKHDPYQMQLYSANKYHNQQAATQNHFIDDDFPHSKKSIFMNKRIKLSSLLLLDGLSKAKLWMRPMDIKCDSSEKHLPITLFSNPNPKDVIQGGVGSCWFISALSALADRPELLYQTIMPKFYNVNGFHQVRLCHRGQWVEIPIDDYLPCDRKKKLIFAYSKNRQFWTSFIEKALAKLNGLNLSFYLVIDDFLQKK
jgi:calpain-15